MLLIASKAKLVVKANQDMRTGQDALDALSAHVSQVLGNAAKIAAEDGRRTVAERDIVAALAVT